MLEERLRGLESQLERSESERDAAKLALSTHIALYPPPRSSQPETQNLVLDKKSAKRKSMEDHEDANPTNKKRKRKTGGPKSVETLNSSKEITPSRPTFEMLLEEIEYGKCDRMLGCF